MSHFKYVVLGGGNSSGYAARQFVNLGGGPRELCIITNEAYVSYERPALSKAYLFPDKPARLPGFHTCVGGGGERQDPDWYAKHGIEFMVSTQVTELDKEEKVVKTDQGESISYDTLIIATGARVSLMYLFSSSDTLIEHIYLLFPCAASDSVGSQGSWGGFERYILPQECAGC